MRHHNPGNMIINFSIQYPEKISELTPVQKFNLKSLMGMRPDTQTVAEKEMREKWELEYVKRLEQLRHQEMKDRRAGKHVMLVSELAPPAEVKPSPEDMDLDDMPKKQEPAKPPAPAVLEGVGDERDPFSPKVIIDEKKQDPLIEPIVDKLKDFDQSRYTGSNGTMEDDEEDGAQQDGGRVQCAQQ